MTTPASSGTGTLFVAELFAWLWPLEGVTDLSSGPLDGTSWYLRIPLDGVSTTTSAIDGKTTTQVRTVTPNMLNHSLVKWLTKRLESICGVN